MKSMTGFGYSSIETDRGTLRVEIKTLNGRYLDLVVNLPPTLSQLDTSVRTFLKQHFHRGRVECSVFHQKKIYDLEIDKPAALAWIKTLNNLCTILGNEEKITVNMLEDKDGVIREKMEDTPQGVWNNLESLLKTACEQVLTDREKEGLSLKSDIDEQLNTIETELNSIKTFLPEYHQLIKTKINERLTLLSDSLHDESMIMTETASWLVKSDINEEIVRLSSHLSMFRNQKSEILGKKLDFLAQEMNREINTIGSKSVHTKISQTVVYMKDALEKIREQLRNVE